jgi:L-aspartate oxidase
MAELAPRDVVARAIVHELEISRMKDPVVYLDLTHLDEAHVKARFPRIYSTCLQFNIDIATDLIPIRPAAHYSMGGVRTDLDARTSVAGLYAAGEVASTGVHGANRLASNSLLEGLVFGARAGKKMRDQLHKGPAGAQMPIREAYSNGPVDATAEEVVREIQDLMWQDVGIVRTAQGMKHAIEHLGQMSSRVGNPYTRRAWEAQNLQSVGMLIARSALARQESRGAHYRTDFPTHDDAKFLKHSLVSGNSVRFI